MTDETVELCDNDFLTVAVRHGLLQRKSVAKIISHAQETGVQPSDAALTLSMLEIHEVDAIQWLCQPTELASGYTLTGLIGCGAAGLVFRAHQTAMDRDVALKTINGRSLHTSTKGQSRIQRESRAIARLHHPHIVAAFDSGFHQGRFCIAMELVDGETLADLIASQSTLSESITWHIARQVASALAHANDAGITHRDIKPANLLVSATPQGMTLPPGVPFVKVVDFGLALQSSDDAASQITATGTTLGTPAYVAPEQLHDTHVDARADIYSLGATVYHMLTGSAPYADRSPMRTIMQKTIGDDRWRNDIPPTLSPSTVALFRDMTETNPDQRIGEYHELIARIDACLAELENRPASSNSPSPPITRSKHFSTAFRGVVLVSVLTIGLGTLVFGLGKIVIGFANRSEPPATAVASATQWTVNGLPQPLFNGKSVPLFRQSGSWSPGIASDGSRVLVGREGAQMTIPMRMTTAPGGAGDRDLRVRVALLSSAESQTDIDLVLSASQSPIAVLRFDQGSVLFIPDAAGTNAPRAGSERSLDLPAAAIDDGVFRRISIQRQGDVVSLSVNGEELGRVACDPNATSSVRLRCVKNDSSFADIDIVAVTPLP